MNYWLHRISHIANLAYPLLDRGFLSIGFSDFTDKEFIEKVKQDDWNYFNQQFSDKWGLVPRTRHNLWRFLHFQKGDIVIVPSSGTFYVCEILDEQPMMIGEVEIDNLKTWGGKVISTNGRHLHAEDGHIYDLGFARRIKVLHQKISRSKYADAKLTSRMKMRQTNGNISDLEENIQNSIERFIENRPVDLHSIIIDETTSKVLSSIRNELNPNKFEKLVKTYFKTIGADDVSIPAKNKKDKEGDADIVAVFENIKLIIYVQAKFHRGIVDELGANQILDYKTNQESIADGYNKIAWVITSADEFNEGAEKFAVENEIQLINGLEFSTMLMNAGINMLKLKL